MTVGKGKMLPDAARASALPFRVRATDVPAADEEIRAEYDLIAGMEASQTRGAAFYEQFTSLSLPQADIDELVQDHLRQDFEALLRQYPGFGNLPLSAQIALWDMIYNLGPTGLAQFQMLRQAILDEAKADDCAGCHICGNGQIGSANEDAMIVDHLDELDIGRCVIDLDDLKGMGGADVPRTRLQAVQVFATGKPSPRNLLGGDTRGILLATVT
ncbi:hypothetical protein [Tabrizicola sp.]|uniref:hypothetical protein n=1 Tax=Tabrizicola sp. TaxID=2005166 RepID=UPI00273742BF|nr:hypothetical protein [Tabrizicola sp.]